MSQNLAKHFGNVVRRRRLRLGLSQEGLAFRSHLSTTFISRVERGACNPSLSTMDRMAQALGTTISSLVSAMERGRRAAADP